MAARKSLERTIQLHYGLVFNSAYRVLGDVEEARDAAQDTFITYAQRPPQGEVKSLPAWLHRVATNKAINRRSSSIRRTTREHSYVELTPKTTDVIIASEIAEALDEAIDRLPENLRTPLIEHYYSKRSHREIAAELDVPRQTITSRIERGINQLKKDLNTAGVSATIPIMLAHMTAEASPAVYTHMIARTIQLTQAATPATVATLPISISTLGYAVAPIVVASVALVVWMVTQGTNGVNAQPEAPTVDKSITDIANSDSDNNVLAQATPTQSVTPKITQVDSSTTRPTTWRYEQNIPPGFPPALVPEDVGPIRSADEFVSIEGIVVSENGEPVNGARITLTATGHVGPEVALASYAAYRNLTNRYTTQTDSEGHYRIENVAFAGNARISAGAMEYPSQSQFIGVSAGEDTKNVNFILSKRGMHLRGRLKDSNGNPIIDATITAPTYVSDAMVTSSVARNITTTDAEGRFAFSMFHTASKRRGFGGSASIFAICPDGSRALFSNVRFDQDSMIELVMPKSASVYGKVTSDLPGPYYVWLTGQLEETYEGRTISDYALTNVYGAWSDGEGNYTIENIPPNHTFKLCVVDGNASDVIARRDTPALSPAETRRVDVAATNECVVTGRVIDSRVGAPLAHVRVGYHHPQSNPVYMERAWTDEGGYFRLVVPRDLKNVRLFPTYYIAHRTGIQKSIEEFGKNISVASPSQTNVTLEMPAPVPITLLVRDETGAPAPDIMIWQQTPSGFTNAQGEIGLLLAPPTDTSLTLEAEGYLPRSQNLDYETLGDTLTVTMSRTSGGFEARLGSLPTDLPSELQLDARVIPYAPAGEDPGPVQTYTIKTRPLNPGDYFVAREWLPVGQLESLTITHPADPDELRWIFEDIPLESGTVLSLGTLE